jgi:hypothetical protein
MSRPKATNTQKSSHPEPFEHTGTTEDKLTKVSHIRQMPTIPATATNPMIPNDEPENDIRM